MEYSAESLRYLHLAYVLMIVGQIAYVAWLGARWSRTEAKPVSDDAAR